MRVVGLGEVAEIVMGQAPSGDTYNDNKIGMPLIAGASDFGEIYPRPSRFTSAPWKKTIIGDVILCIRATIGDMNWADKEYCLGRGVAAIRPKKGCLEKHYLWRVLEAGSQRLAAKGRGATFKQVTRSDIAELEIPLPPIEEQKRIAAILDQADSLRRLRKRAIDRLNSLGQAIFFEMFVSDCEAANWPVTTVAELAEQTRTGPFGSQLLHSEFVDEGIAVLGIDNAVNNEFCWARPRHITPEKYRDLQRYTVKPGDVLITLMGTCGRCAVVPDDIPLAINTKHLCCITLRQDIILPEYLHSAFLQHPRILKQLGVQAKGAVMPGLNMSIIRELEIVLPPMNIQRAYNKRKLLIASQLRSSVEHQKRLNTLFASSQHRAFRGEL